MTVERCRSRPCHCWEEGENLKSASTSWTVEWPSTADHMFAWAGDECLCKYKSLYISCLKEPHSLSVGCLCWSGVTRCSGWGWVREVGCIPEASWRLKRQNQRLQTASFSEPDWLRSKVFNREEGRFAMPDPTLKRRCYLRLLPCHESWSTAKKILMEPHR